MAQFDAIIEKYLKRLHDANLDGFRCCIVDFIDEFIIHELFSEKDGFYFTSNSENRLYLNWK